MNTKRQMKTFAKKSFLPVLLALFCFIVPPRTANADHINYYCESGRGGDNGTQCNEDAIDVDVVYDKNGSRLVRTTKFTVKAWQQCVNKKTSEADTIFGICHKDCLDKVINPKYYNDPKTPGIQNNKQNIKLPVVLAWDNVRGFGDNRGQYDACTYDSHHNDCHHLEKVKTFTGDGYGPISYRIQIQDDSANGIGNLTIPTIKNGQVEIADNGKQAFYAILDKNAFNSLEDAGPCFFNSTDTYHWRVVACCNANGTGCKDWPRDWWTFTASTAPEPSVPPNKISSLMDPDWNGKNGAAAESFKDIVPSKEPLRWCAAKLPAEYQIAGRPVQYAKSYKIEVTSDEQNSFTEELRKKITDWISWISGNSSSDSQSTHSLSIINGGWLYEIKPVGGNIYSWYSPLNNRGSVETWYPSQGRQDLAYFSREHIYSWKLQSCTDDIAKVCFCDNGEAKAECADGTSPEYSQEWKVKTPFETISSPEAISPKNDPEGKDPVGFPISLSWTIPSGANSFRYKTTIPGLEEGKTSWSSIPNNEFDDNSKNLFTLEKSNLKLDTLYKWQVRSCAQFDPDATKKSGGLDCDEWSEEFSFRTTGRPPLQSSMEPNLSSTITFPQNFKWEKVPGAKSYNFKLFDGTTEIAAAAKTVKFGSADSDRPGTQADYPNILPPVGVDSKPYTWKVQTCADENGKYCGGWQSQYFKTARPETPTLENQNRTNGSLNDAGFSWTGQTKYYQVTINYEKGTVEQSDCDLENPIVNKIIDKNSCSVSNGCIPSNIKGSCVGTYKWTVQPCVNPDCSDKGDDNRLSDSFLVVKQTSESKDTVAVCGQTFNNSKTSWDETEKCEVKHIFMMIKIIIDFFLFKLSIMILPILALITGGFFYLGKEGPNTVKYIKDAWIRIGIGYAILFMAWLLVSWIMAAAGFEGDWWKIL